MVQEFRGKCRKGLCRETAPILFGLSDQLLRLRELNWHIDAQSPRQGTNPDWLCGEDEGLSRSREKKGHCHHVRDRLGCGGRHTVSNRFPPAAVGLAI